MLCSIERIAVMMVSSSAGDVLERRRLMAPEAPFLVALDY
jgi:hypothetical protein